MTYNEVGISLNEEILNVAATFNLDPHHLQVEFFNAGHQAIFVEEVGAIKFRIHLSLEEKRIISVKQISGPAEHAPGEPDPFAKYKAFMK
ncbi:hypothetical protein KJ068_03315 [bacterium]|nr:hypothetical protein [bacterium]RIK78547.1 MAG: hypothetical protein DCC62_07225 [candidate division KSB1 bacterium]